MMFNKKQTPKGWLFLFGAGFALALVPVGVHRANLGEADGFAAVAHVPFGGL
jgi:hypothetical protein